MFLVSPCGEKPLESILPWNETLEVNVQTVQSVSRVIHPEPDLLWHPFNIWRQTENISEFGKLDELDISGEV